ncbi:MAG: triose-phosphate isomerase [Alphaproteobacteria bacterium]
MAERRKLIAGNWKMNGLRADGIALAGGIAAKAFRGAPACDVVVCPPAPLLAKLDRAFDGSTIVLGGQDCHPAPSGAHTGDISAEMLRDAGCRYVIVGHSERRADHGEGNDQVRAKAHATHRAGMTAIVCVGETKEDRDANRTLAVVEAQIVGSMPQGATGGNTVIAYEPVWAIGSGKTPTLDEIAAVHGHIRGVLSTALGQEAAGVRVLYGGSVNAKNASEILEVTAVDGALVGGASLKVEDFWTIVTAAGAP